MHPPRPTSELITPVGRSPELDRLDALFEATRGMEGEARAALITGPAGVGKSHVASAFKARLRRRGDAAFETWCSQTDYRPHGPLVDLLGSAATLMHDVGARAPHLESALHRINGLLPNTDADLNPPELAFFETVRQGLIELSTVVSPVAIIHDLHLADVTTLGLMRYLIENLLTDPAFEWAPGAEGQPRFRGLLILSFRVDDRTKSLLDSARASNTIAHIPLQPLARDGIAAFLQSPRIIEQLERASGGLPAALEELFASLPQTPAGAWQQRLQRIPEGARPLLNIIATYGRPCTLPRLQELTPADFNVRAHLPTLVERRVLSQIIERGTVKFRFVRDGARERYYADLDVTVRRRTHRELAERLAIGGGFGEEPAEIAHHYLAGGAAAEAVPFAIAAADTFRSASAYIQAASLLEKVLPAIEGQLRHDILDQLVDLYINGGVPNRARDVLTTLVGRSDNTDQTALNARLARLHAKVGDQGAAKKAASACLAGEPSETLNREMRAIKANAAYLTGDLKAAEAAATMDESELDASTLSLRNTLGKVCLERGAFDRAQDVFDHYLRDAEALNEPIHQARALINLGVACLQRGAGDAALGWFERAREHCVATGDVRRLALAVENLAVLQHRRQAFGEALAYYHQSTAVFRQLGQITQLATAALNLADLYLTVGDLERAHRLADIAKTHIARNQLRSLETQHQLVRGEIARAEGDLETASRCLKTVIAALERGELSNQRLGPVLWSQAELQLTQNQAGKAQASLERALAAVSGQDELLEARIRATRGAVLQAQGDLKTAMTEFESAAEQSAKGGDHEAEWRALARLANAAWAADDRPATVRALGSAVDVIEQVAASLPESLSATYLNAPARRQAREGLRRARAGMSPSSVTNEAEATRSLRPKSAEWRPEWGHRYPQIIGHSNSLYPVFNALDRVSDSDSMVLIRGGSGTGKELVAEALHTHSPRAKKPFIKVNCAAFVETLLLSELFGHEKGAFTGAVTEKKGRFELADKGTLFLDEIGDISPNTQVALLRVLQERTFERVGGASTIRVDVRVICATHRDLEAMVQSGEFRADLYYRLRGVIIEVPALCDRKEDIPLLVAHFLNRRKRTTGRALCFTPNALASLLQHSWPGNVRELENVVRSVALFADGDTIDLPELAELGDIFRKPDDQTLLDLAELASQEGVVPATQLPTDQAPKDKNSQVPGQVPGQSGSEEIMLTDRWFEQMLKQEGSLSDLKKRIEFEAIARALRATGGNITRAAGHLGMKRPRLSQIIHATPELGDLKRKVSKS